MPILCKGIGRIGIKVSKTSFLRIVENRFLSKNCLYLSAVGRYKNNNFVFSCNPVRTVVNSPLIYCKNSNPSKMPPQGFTHDFRYSLSPEDLLKKTDDLITECKQLYDKVASVPDSDVSFETVLKVLNEAECLMSTNAHYLEFAQHVCTNEAIRNASTTADRKFRELSVELTMRKDVFNKLQILQKKGGIENAEANRYLEKLILSGKRKGLHLSEETQKQIKDLNTQMNNLSVDFSKNLNDVTTTLEFSKEELNGLTDDFFQSLKKNPDSGKFEVTLKYPHYFPVMEKCKVPETRKKLEFAFNTQCLDENARILTELRKLRHQVATMLGYPSHAAYITEILMSKSAQTVKEFLTELAEKMTPLWKEEKQYLLELKEKDCAELGLPFDGKLNSYDTTYYITQCKEKKYAVDQTKLREYFPFPIVKIGLLTIYQDLLGLKFEQVKEEAWHEDVELYSVSDSKSGKLLGYFFLDLFPRPNKYGHAALFELQHSIQFSDGRFQPAVGAMVANFTKPTDEKPALLDHNEVVTFFHEFGHVMHYICMELEYPYFNIENMERDFIEAPSQMLENWCWEKDPILKMSSHYVDNSVIPSDMLDAVIKSRLANIGHSTLRQVCLALYDQTIHTSPEGDIGEIYSDIVKKIVGIEPQKGTNFACHFNHLANEYDARYYGYLWSEVYSMDMFQCRFGKKNVLNPDVGKDYRNKILKPGGIQDAHNLVCSFLGREPTRDAFLRSKGLKI